MGQKTTHDVEPEKKKLDLSAAQVAGSSLATVAAALLASKLGVYGTILGAGVVSVVATAGGPVIQHFFRRTGDQLRETARPRARQVPLPGEPGPCEEFGEATVHGTRVRGWKRTAVAAGAVFAISLGVLGSYEAIAGTSVSADGGTILSGGTRKASDHQPSRPQENPGGGEKDGGTPGSGTSPAPSGSHSGGGRSPSSTPGPSDSGDPVPSPSPPKPTPTPTPTPPTPTPTPTPSPDASAPSGQQQSAP
ncbi:hypothetical protein OG765_09565 [Streptomyces sp. NBC_00555]|uniref:hypothetical protein n=1 Tax=Streptomyces sp. NBC_00555 TaxID=2903662 RepID=UPI002253F805|nr:hypothetical protein [Streptomyces sp. NBC_00555]MCX5011236.1 hypothetical protein [Streptomyces sp. NBC_00555]